ncbi:MAG: ImmA/IrrE family metallo-endopeptidase [Leuconostoc mesenteroides]|nr:ImmA/IrrE family metallo-endopeptidase [Candidatus Methanofastidiosa archaeon]
MLSKIKRLVKELGIEIQYMEFSGNGYFGIEENKPIIFINEQLNDIDTSLTILHETAHFLNGDCDKYITNHFQNDNLEFKANKYMIQEVMKMLDEKYEFTPDTNYQKIINTLNLPYHLDGIIIDEFNSIISDKFSMTPYHELDYFYE